MYTHTHTHTHLLAILSYLASNLPSIPLYKRCMSRTEFRTLSLPYFAAIDNSHMVILVGFFPLRAWTEDAFRYAERAACIHVCVCVCVCVCACMRSALPVYMCVYVCICVYLCVYACMYVCIDVFAYVVIYVCM